MCTSLWVHKIPCRPHVFKLSEPTWLLSADAYVFQPRPLNISQLIVYCYTTIVVLIAIMLAEQFSRDAHCQCRWFLKKNYRNDKVSVKSSWKFRWPKLMMSVRSRRSVAHLLMSSYQRAWRAQRLTKQRLSVCMCALVAEFSIVEALLRWQHSSCNRYYCVVVVLCTIAAALRQAIWMTLCQSVTHSSHNQQLGTTQRNRKNYDNSKNNTSVGMSHVTNDLRDNSMWRTLCWC